MRIAVVNWTRRAVGGAETTMALPLTSMARAGHEIALWYEVDRPADRPILQVPDGPLWCAEALGPDRALSALRDWRPDVLYLHGLLDPGVEGRLLSLAPGVFFAHSYYGTCISGNKTLTFPRVRPCLERFGVACLLRYYPRRTGGLNPVTMVTLYRRQSRRLANLHACRYLVVLSDHMRHEYLQHGFAAERVIRLPFPPGGLKAPAAPPASARPASGPWRLLFVGRMDPLKGGAELIRAAPAVVKALDAPIDLTMVGDGPSGARWRALANDVAAAEPRLKVQFPGWLASGELPAQYAAADLLIMPSLWPEPFGRIGLEAGVFGLPTVAFAVGGVPEWLRDGLNGHLAPGDPPSISGLAEAIVRTLRDVTHYQALRRNALEAARAVDPEQHARALLDLLQRASAPPT